MVNCYAINLGSRLVIFRNMITIGSRHVIFRNMINIGGSLVIFRNMVRGEYFKPQSLH